MNLFEFHLLKHSATGTQVAPFQTIEKAKAAAAALSAGGDVTVQEVVSSASIR